MARLPEKEENKSYLLLFVILGFILVTATAWAIVNETFDRRPWKYYQRRFHHLEFEKITQEYEKERTLFESTDIQKKYEETKQRLEIARGNFRKPPLQEEYRKLTNEQTALNRELESLKFKAMVTRNESMEKEFLYGKSQSELIGQIQDEIKVLEERGRTYAVKIKETEDKLTSIKSRVKELEHDIVAYTDELNSYTIGMKKQETLLANLRKTKPGLQVYQTYLADLNVVDRCMSCHVGINKTESVSAEQPFASHPDRELYLDNHPPEKFGCVLCHEGQANATSGVKEAHGELEYWLTPIYRGKAAQGSCIRCHNEGKEVKGGDVLWQGKRLFEELGCYGCHETEGFGKDKNRMIGPSLRNVKNKVKAEWLTSWIKDPKAFRPTTLMPDFRLSEEESQSIAAYLWQQADEKTLQEEMPPSDEEQLTRGDFIFEHVGCMACHTYEADAKRGFAPNLARIGEKINYGYLTDWIINPKSKEPHTRMPNFRMNQEKARLVAGYLINKTGGDVAKEGFPDAKWLEDKDRARTGKALIIRYGCFGCHEIKGMEGLGKTGTELSAVGSKDVHLFDFGLLEKKILREAGLKHFTENVGEARRAWLRAKLHNPRQFDEGKYKKPEDRLKMPDFGLQDDEIESLIVFLTGLREEKLPEAYIDRLTEGERAITEGKRFVGKYNCSGCHQLDVDRLYLVGGTELKGLVKLDEENGVYFQLLEDSHELKQKAGDTVFIEKERIAQKKRTPEINLVSEIIKYHTEEQGLMPEEARVFAPPLLYAEGRKVQCEWAFEFLTEPFDLRPWLDVKMPTFSLPADEASSLVRFFTLKDGESYPFEYIAETKKDYIEKKEAQTPGYLSMAKRLFESEDVHCLQCHIKGGKMPEGEPADWAPDLTLAKKRLKPAWIKRWLLDPQSIQPGTKMPKFFREGEFQDYIPGTPEEQAEVIKDYIMNLRE